MSLIALIISLLALALSSLCYTIATRKEMSTDIRKLNK